MVLLAGCTETELRCHEGYRANGTLCVSLDAGMDAGATPDVGAFDGGLTDSGPSMDVCNPSASDPPGDGVDGNCDGVDGTRADTIFVSPDGADTNSGLEPAQPVRTVSAALAIAQGTTRRSILVAVGTYDATPVSLGDGGAEMIASHRLVDGVTISGRYAGGAGGWVSHATDATQRSVLRGQVAAAFAFGLTTAVTFHDVDLVSELANPFPGLSCYGLLVSGSGQVTLSRGRVLACRGTAAPMGMADTGAAGTEGSVGGAGTAMGRGGSGCGGEAGRGGDGGSATEHVGVAGVAGTMTREGGAPAGGAGGTDGVLAGTGGAGPVGGAGASPPSAPSPITATTWAAARRARAAARAAAAAAATRRTRAPSAAAAGAAAAAVAAATAGASAAPRSACTRGETACGCRSRT